MKSALNKIFSKVSGNDSQDNSVFLSKYIRNKAVREVDNKTVKEIEALLLHTDCIAGQYYPTADSDQLIPVEKQPSQGKLPVPPEKFWHWYAQEKKHTFKEAELEQKHFGIQP